MGGLETRTAFEKVWSQPDIVIGTPIVEFSNSKLKSMAAEALINKFNDRTLTAVVIQEALSAWNHGNQAKAEDLLAALAASSDPSTVGRLNDALHHAKDRGLRGRIAMALLDKGDHVPFLR
jgi:hypothetical protein